MNAQNTFGSRLRKLRESKKLKAKDLSKVLGCSASLIYNIEKGYNEPQPDFIVRVATFFDVTTDFLLGNEQKKYLPSDKEIASLLKDLDKESKMVIFDLVSLLGKKAIF